MFGRFKSFYSLAACALLGCTLSLPLAQSAQAQVETPKSPQYGVTLDDLTQFSAIIASLQHLPYRPTVRVVFDPGTSAADYYPYIVKLHQYAYVMGEIFDSYYFPTNLSIYTARTKELVSTLGSNVDVWEIANEINGEWLRANPNGPTSTATTEEQQIGQMVQSAYNVVKGTGGKVAVTMYYNQDPSGNNCWALPMDNWRTWPTQFLSSTVRNGADYALFSYYPYQDCPGLNPSWKNDFAKLESLFPNAKVGFGEIGTSDTSAPWSVQSNLITTYYPMVNSMSDPKFIGGFFWWNYVEEMLPYSTSQYFQLLRNTIINLKAPS
jgi:hypothetical protein